MQEYVNNFLKEAKQEQRTIVIDSLIVQFVPYLGDTAMGQCYRTGIDWSGIPTVLIRRPSWDGSSDSLKEVMLFHELGHCILLREHLNTWTNDIVTSIMYYSLQREPMYSDNWRYYMHELFYE